MTPLFHTLFPFFKHQFFAFILSFLYFPFFLFCVLHSLSSFFVCFSLYNFFFFTFFMFLYHLLHFFLLFFIFSLFFFTLPCPLFAFYVTIFCSSLNYKVCLCHFLLSSSLLSLILFLFIFYFPLFSSCFYPLASSLSCILHPFPPLFPSVLLLFYTNFSLSAISPSCRCIRVYTGESFCSRIEMPCNYEARGKYHLSRDAISSWLIVIALSYYSRNG